MLFKALLNAGNKRKQKEQDHLDRMKEIAVGQVDDIQKFLKMYGAGRRYCSIRKGPCNTEGFFLWEKDKDHNYVFANEMHCVEFFGLQGKCREEVEGKSDIDLVNAFRERTGLQHSYGELCIGSDEIVKKAGKECRFIEIGYIGEQLFILDVKKIPSFDNAGTFNGTTGIAIDLSGSGSLVKVLIETGLKQESIKIISIEKNVAAVYQVVSNYCGNIFINGFPE